MKWPTKRSQPSGEQVTLPDPAHRDSTKDEDPEKQTPSDNGSGSNVDVQEGDVLHRKLKGRHMQMIAIGGSIGTGLFVGSGSALQSGGPASLVIDFILIGIMLFMTVHALGEMAVLYPVAGAFYTYSVRFIDPAWGFAMGWNYWMSWAIVLPTELTAASITIQYWRKDINVGVWITVFLVAVTAVNFFGVRGYGEVEFILGVIKIVAVIGFIILGIIIDVGGVPSDTRGYIGGEYWSNPGAFRNGFKGFCSVFVTAAFAFAGTELVGLAAAEADNPRKSLPRATKQVFWRIALFYVISLTLIGLIVRSDSPDLLNASGGNTAASPFVLAIKYANIRGLPSVFNAVITLSVLSVANSCTYGSTRTLHALAEQHMAPKMFAYVDSRGRPLIALALALLFGCLAYINEAAAGNEIFDWLLALSGLSAFFTWGSINLAHIRFRAAWKAQGKSVDDLPFKAACGVWGSWVGFLLNVLCLIAQFYVALFPLDGDRKPNAKEFFKAYLAAPIVLAFYAGYKIYSRIKGRRDGWYVSAMEADVKTGRRELNTRELDEQERAEMAAKPRWKRWYNHVC